MFLGNQQTNFFCGKNGTITGRCRKPICLKKPCRNYSNDNLVCDFFLNNKTGKSNIFGRHLDSFKIKIKCFNLFLNLKKTELKTFN